MLAEVIVLLTHHGHPQVRPQAVDNATVSVASQWDDVKAIQQLRQRASRSEPERKPLPHVQCWNGSVVADHPGRQDCPNRPAPKPRVTHLVVSGSVYAWAHGAFAIRVANCESGGGPSDHHSYYDGDPHLRDGNYHGKWQMDADFWRTYGGLRYAGDAADATEAEQDAVAYKGYLARGWEPWECAHLV